MKAAHIHIHNSPTEDFMALAELGKQAKVIFHDLANHFTSLNLTIRELENNLEAEKNRFEEYSKRSNETRTQIEYVANLLRSHLRGREESFYAEEVITEIIELYQQKLDNSNIKITLDLDKHAYFTSGKRHFIQIITNLIGNAIESFETTPTRLPREIGIHLFHDQTNFQLTVSDTGCGIRKENLEKIFTGMSTKENGHGIGLMAVKENIEKFFKGSIKVESSKSGATFHIIFPKQNRKPELPVLSNNPDGELLSESFKSLSHRSTI